MVFDAKEETEKFILIYNKYKNIMFKYSNNILKDEKDAEDAVQDAFIKVINNLDKIDIKNFKSTFFYLITIVQNESKSIYKKNKKTKLNNKASTVNIISHKNEVEKYFFEKLKYNELLKKINSLDKQYKMPFLLKFVYDYNEEKIAKILINITKNNVSVRIHRAKLKLKKIIF